MTVLLRMAHLTIMKLLTTKGLFKISKQFSIHNLSCSADPSLLGEVTYANDKILAHVRSFIFSFIDVQSLLFTCKLSLCLRDKDGCEGISVNL